MIGTRGDLLRLRPYISPEAATLHIPYDIAYIIRVICDIKLHINSYSIYYMLCMKCLMLQAPEVNFLSCQACVQLLDVSCVMICNMNVCACNDM